MDEETEAQEKLLDLRSYSKSRAEHTDSEVHTQGMYGTIKLYCMRYKD